MSTSSSSGHTTGSFFSLSRSPSQRKKKAPPLVNDSSAEATLASLNTTAATAPAKAEDAGSNIKPDEGSLESITSGLFDGSPEFDRLVVDNSIPTTPALLSACREACISSLPDKQLPPEQTQYFNSDHNVRRYLVARKGKAGEAGKQLAATLVWRSERGLVDGAVHNPNHLTDSFVPVGLDRRKYVVIYSNHARAQLPNNGNAETTFDHAFQVLETCCNDEIGVARTLWVIDFNGFSHKHICKRHIQLGCAWFGAHNPERLGAMVLVNPPMMFMALWSFIHMFLDPESAQRLIVFRSSAEAQAYFEDYCSPETSKWLMDVSKIAPKVGGGYPPGTDFSLLDRTQWRGPPHSDTLTLPSRHAAVASVRAASSCVGESVDQAKTPISVRVEGAASEPPSPQSPQTPPVSLKVESKEEGSEERRDGEQRTASASPSNSRSRLDTSPASHAFMDPRLGLTYGTSGGSSSSDSSSVSSSGSISSSNSSGSVNYFNPVADDAAAAAHARAVRAIAASGLNVPEDAEQSLELPKEQAILYRDDDLNAINAFIDEPFAEPIIGPQKGNEAANSWPGGARNDADSGSGDATTATAAAAGAGAADYGFDNDDDDDNDDNRRKAGKVPTSSSDDKEGKHHKKVAAGAAALFVMGTMTAGAAVAAVAVGGGVAGYYHRRREKEREKERKANEALGSSNGSSSSNSSNENGGAKQPQEGNETNGKVNSRSGAAAAEESEASAPKANAKPHFRRRRRRGKSPVNTGGAIVNPVVGTAHAEDIHSV